jgi:outer membrane protein OmpA-like peptidoglycan-associated protein
MRENEFLKRKNITNIFLLITLLICLITFPLTSEDGKSPYLFAYEDGVGDTYNLKSFVSQSMYLDENHIGSYDYKYEGDLEVVDKMGTSSKLKGSYYAYNKPTNSSEPYRLINKETAETEFIRRPNGKMVIDRSYLYPTVRDVPLFPDKAISPGKSWEAKALEVMDLTELGATEPYRIPLSVLYTYEGDETFQEREVAVLSIKYYFEYNLFEKPNPNSKDTRPIFLTGMFEGKYYWDKESATPLYYEANSIFTYTLKNATVLEIRSSEYGEVVKDSPLIAEKVDEVDKDRKGEIAEDIEEELRKKELDEDFEVEENDKGVIINLSDILFDFAKSELREESIEKLDEIAKILKRYENFAMLIEGHTDNIGTASDNQDLSEDRAKSVKDYLILKGISPDALVSKGYGESSPKASNDTDEGRALNRRVEIIIITDKDESEDEG